MLRMASLKIDATAMKADPPIMLSSDDTTEADFNFQHQDDDCKVEQNVAKLAFALQCSSDGDTESIEMQQVKHEEDKKGNEKGTYQLSPTVPFEQEHADGQGSQEQQEIGAE